MLQLSHVGALVMGGQQLSHDYPKIGNIWSFSQNYYQLPKVPLVQPKIGLIWSFSQKLPPVALGTPGEF